jgi:hypothetical protein
MLIAILCVWVVQKWKGNLLMKNVSAEDKPFIILTRIALAALLVFLSLMVWIVWKRREQNENGKGTE